jgi:hypothetical protein
MASGTVGESIKGLLRTLVQFQDLPGTNYINGICWFCKVDGQVKQDGAGRVFQVRRAASNDPELIQLTETPGSKVQKEIMID